MNRDTLNMDTLIIGAGVVGSSVAMHLSKAGQTDVCVVDLDMEGRFSSSELNAGAVRASMVQPINIILSKHSIEFYAKIKEEVGYRSIGYLWLHSDKTAEVARQAQNRHLQEGWEVQEWGFDELGRRVPFIDKREGIQLILFYPRDGLVNPNLLKLYFRAEARKRGVEFRDRLQVVKVEWDAGKNSFAVDCKKIPVELSDAELVEILEEFAVDNGSVTRIFCKRIVNASGAWASECAQHMGYAIPSKPVRRQVCIFDSREVNLSQYGMIVDPSGVYFHPEGINGLAGYADPSEPTGKNFHYDGEMFFLEKIWPALYERSKGFERLRHITGWAGLYEVSPDHSAIIGEVSKTNLTGAKIQGRLYEAHSFSGHGVMHSYAAGLGLAELMAFGKYETADLKSLSAKRFETGALVKESLVI